MYLSYKNIKVKTALLLHVLLISLRYFCDSMKSLNFLSLHNVNGVDTVDDFSGHMVGN